MALSEKRKSREAVVGLKRTRKLHEISDSESEDLFSDLDSVPSISSSVGVEPKKSIYSKNSGTVRQQDQCDYQQKRKSKCANRHDDHEADFKQVPVSRASSSRGDSKTATNYGFYLSKVTGISSNYNDYHTRDIKDILSPSYGKLVSSVQFSYQIDIPWLVEQYPSEFRNCPLMIVHGEQRESKRKLEKEASPYKNVTLCQAKLEIMYGTHHTKMMLLLYNDGIRVVIHTANLVHGDWFQKTQGIWISSKFPKMTGDKGGDSATNFKKDLIFYLKAYGKMEINQWCKHIEEHDMSSANVFIIGSSPGRHTGLLKTEFGHLKMKRVLTEHGPSKDVSKWEVIGQFSSIGSLGSDPSNWLCGEWLSSFSATKSLSFLQKAPLKLVYPTVDNVRTSLEGYPAGASLPYSIQVASRQMYLKSYMHQWKSEALGRSKASPHIKTYFRLSPDLKYFAWFLLTSANLSKAAWGMLEKQGSQFMIRSYELGVLFLPNKFDEASFFYHDPKQNRISEGRYFKLPFDLPLTPYSKNDEHWVWNIPYTKAPDTHGNIWCPPCSI